MVTRSAAVRLVVAAALLVGVAACGSSSKTSPVAPSTSLSVQPGASSGATIVGLVNGVAPGMIVAADGTGLTSAVDSSGRFQLAGLPAGDVQLRFTATGVDAKATVPAVASEQRVEITVTVTGNTATIVADVRGGQDSSAEAEGLVTGAGGSCPALAFSVGGATVRTTAQTVFSGGTCADVKDGVKVDVKGARQADGSISAQSVRVEVDAAAAELKGAVSALSGTCPSLTFSIGATTVKTTAQTAFTGGACSDIKAGTTVDVEGTSGSDGSVAARSVGIEGMENTSQDLEGIVSAVNSGAQSFVVTGITVRVTAQTVIVHGSTSLQFADIKAGVRVHVKGSSDSSGAVTAARIELQNDNPTPPTADSEVVGTVSSVSASCPSLRFAVKGTTITTGPLTTYSGGNCADIGVGASVDVRGLVQADASLAASWVKIDKKGSGK